MSTQDFVNAVFGRLNDLMVAEFPGVTVLYENGPEVDEASVGEMFLDAEVRWYGANLITMELDPTGRHTGAVSLQVFYRQAQGTAAVGRLLDRLITEFKSKRIGGGVTKMPQRSVPTHLNGWYKSGIFIPFHLDHK